MNPFTTSISTVIHQKKKIFDDKKAVDDKKKGVVLSLPHEISTMERKPKRPLSAYNLFFKHQRQVLLSSHGRMGFQELARNIASRWKDADPKIRNVFQSISSKDRMRYKKEVSEWKKAQNQQNYVNADSIIHNDVKKSKSLKKLKEKTMTNKFYYTAPTNRHIPCTSINTLSTAPKSLSYKEKNDSVVMSGIYLDNNKNGLSDRHTSNIDSNKCTPEPRPILPFYNTSLMLGKPLISDLAKKLDKDCLEVLLKHFADPSLMVEKIQ